MSWIRDRITLLRALDELPEMENCPHEVLERLLTMPVPYGRRIAVTMDGPNATALVALRDTGKYWEPVTQGIASFAHLPTTLYAPETAFAAVGLDIHVNYWRGARPVGRGIHQQSPYDVHIVRRESDYEGYWRKAGHWGHISAARRRTRKLDLRIDAPNAAGRIVERWGSRWGEGDALLHPQVKVYQEYMASLHRLHSFELFDDGELVSGITFLAQGRTLYGQCSWTAGGGYERLGAGTRCLDVVVQWAFENGFDAVDLGGGHGYKQFWAPPDGSRWYFRACSTPRFVASRLGRLPEYMGHRLAQAPRRFGRHA